LNIVEDFLWSGVYPFLQFFHIIFFETASLFTQTDLELEVHLPQSPKY
jgi:hypothetical protein